MPQAKTVFDYREYMYKRYRRKETDTHIMGGNKSVIAPFEYYIVNMLTGYMGGKSPLYKIGDYPEFIPEWTFGFHEANSVVTYGGYYLQCITSHNAIDGGIGYNPLEGYAAMWRMYHSKTAEGAEPFLIRNSEDRYMTGDHCTEDGEVYMCIADNVVYPPSVSPESWRKHGATVAEPERETEPTNPYANVEEWKTGTWYQKGDLVKWDGKIYKSIFDGNNVWSPGGYPQGWELIS